MIATIRTSELTQTRQPLVEYFEPDATHKIAPGDMIHDYYGVPLWLLKEYLLCLDATAIGSALFQRGQCWMGVSPAPQKRIGALEIGGARVEFSGVAGDIQAVLTELEWMTQRW